MGISKLNPSAGGIPFGDTAGRPTGATGKLYSNGETARLELYTADGSWENIVQEVPGVASITGNYSQATDSGTITITGTNFVSGAIASAIGTDGVQVNASSTTFNSLVQVTAVFTGLLNANEPYDIKVTNPSNLFGMLPDALYVNASPVWQTASGSLGTFNEQVSISVSATATDSDSTISYSLASGSTLPSGVSLNSSTGAITGTLPEISTDTTYSFTINASDGLNVIPRAFSITSTNTVIELLVVAGGGGGGYDRGSGGGAGGLIDIPQLVVNKNTSYSVSIGNGGAAGISTSVTGGNGQNSVFGTLTAIGGGGGNFTGNGQNGGSGGGGGWSNGTGGSSLQSAQSGDSGTYGYGNAGGAGGSLGSNIIGGGGGAGAAGSTSSPTTSSNRPNGGIGRQLSITGTATYYAGGGGGGQAFDGPNGNTTPYFYLQGLGGLGGGGNGGGTNGGAGTPGTANTGGGGGGGANIPPGPGATGGSGVVIVAYPDRNPALTISAGLTYDQPTRSGYRVYRFTAGSGTVTF